MGIKDLFQGILSDFERECVPVYLRENTESDVKNLMSDFFF